MEEQRGCPAKVGYGGRYDRALLDEMGGLMTLESYR
jgi:hypothetical protein